MKTYAHIVQTVCPVDTTPWKRKRRSKVLWSAKHRNDSWSKLEHYSLLVRFSRVSHCNQTSFATSFSVQVLSGNSSCSHLSRHGDGCASVSVFRWWSEEACVTVGVSELYVIRLGNWVYDAKGCSTYLGCGFSAVSLPVVEHSAQLLGMRPQLDELDLGVGGISRTFSFQHL